MRYWRPPRPSFVGYRPPRALSVSSYDAVNSMRENITRYMPFINLYFLLSDFWLICVWLSRLIIIQRKKGLKGLWLRDSEGLFVRINSMILAPRALLPLRTALPEARVFDNASWLLMVDLFCNFLMWDSLFRLLFSSLIFSSPFSDWTRLKK